MFNFLYKRRVFCWLLPSTGLYSASATGACDVVARWRRPAAAEHEHRERQPTDAETRPSVHRRAHDHHVLGDLRDGRDRQLHHLPGDHQAQVHAHRDQLLSVQSRRVRPHTAGVRAAAGDVVDMVQVSERSMKYHH